MNPRRLFLFFLTLLLLAAERNLCAQWKQVLDSSFGWKDSLHQYLGRDIMDGGLLAVAVSGSTVWAVKTGLWFSEDTAKAWHRAGVQLTQTSVIHVIKFLARTNVLVAT